MKQNFTVTGMSCSACSAHVDKAVRSLTGINEVSVNLITGNMLVDYDEAVTNEENIINAVVSAGYQASSESADVKAAPGIKKKAGISSALIRLISALALLLVLMYISMGHMLSLPIPEILSHEVNPHIYALVQLLLSLSVIIIYFRYFLSGFKKLFSGSPNMDTLVALGSGTAFLYSLIITVLIFYSLLTGDTQLAHEYCQNLYFESAAMILTLISLGKFLEARSKEKTTDSIKKLIELKPQKAILFTDGIEKEIDASEIKPGDILVVKSGQSIPTDGIIIEGNGSIDESALTGESIPVEKANGNKVFQATINRSGYFKMKAEKTGNDTAISQIISLVEAAANSKAPISRLADRVSSIFVPVVMGIALITGIVWLIVGESIGFSLSMAITVLVISCPCALGLATPTAIMAGTGKGAELGILIKSAESLEIAHKIDTVVFDKTGTVTTGVLSVTDVITYSGFENNSFIAMAGSIESMSEHPIARAITEYSGGICSFDVSDYKNIPGGGISACINGRECHVGNRNLIHTLGFNTQSVDNDYNRLAEEGKTPVIFIIEDKIAGIIAVSDIIKPDSRDAVAELHKMGISTLMLTGDNKVTANYIASKAGINKVIADITPADKERIVHELMKEGHKVAMVGDGINDAPALTRADIGIAIGAGTDIAIESADIVLVNSRLSDVSSAIRLSRATIRNIKQNLFWAFFYNTLGIPVAAGVFLYSFGIKLNPMIASAAMSFSSVFVVSNALRLRFFKKTTFTKKEDKIMKLKVQIDGMACHHCTGRVSEVLNAVDGISAEVSLEDKAAYITLSRDISDDEITKIISDAGYTPVSVTRE